MKVGQSIWIKKGGNMRIWLIGADQIGSNALRQFHKNDSVEVIVSDSIERPKAVTDGIIERVNHVESVTSININNLARRIRPDLILIDSTAVQRSFGRSSGAAALSDALHEEMAAASEFPCLVL